MTNKRHPAIVGDCTAAIIAAIRDCRKASDATQSSFLAEHLLLDYDEYETEDFIEALTWLKKASDGDAEAQAVIKACPSWRDEDPQGWYEAFNLHDNDLRAALRLPAPKTKRGKVAKATQDGQDELQRIEDNTDRLPNAWAPDVRPNSATHLVWQALNKLHVDRGAPVPEQDLKDEVMTDYFPADMANREGSYRKAKHNLKEQKAFKESPEGLTPRRTK